jgi:hypothetical protein
MEVKSTSQQPWMMGHGRDNNHHSALDNTLNVGHATGSSQPLDIGRTKSFMMIVSIINNVSPCLVGCLSWEVVVRAGRQAVRYQNPPIRPSAHPPSNCTV